MRAAASLFTNSVACGGSYLDLELGHHQPISSVHRHIENTINQLDHILKLIFPFRNLQWASEASARLARSGRSPLSGCCGALDGIAVRIEQPSRFDVSNPATYFNRKGFNSINIKALCDAEYRLLYISALSPRSSHDSTAFAISSLAKVLQD